MRPIAVLAALLLFMPVPAPARDLDDIKIPDSISLVTEKNPLLLNGAGYRKKFFIKVYIGALYLTEPATQVKTILEAGTARVMRLQFLRDVDKDKLASAWQDGIAANSSASELPGLQARINQLNAFIGSVRTGDVLLLELASSGDTGIWINDKLRGRLSGQDFQKALLKTWIGEKPADAQLKRAVLGGKE